MNTAMTLGQYIEALNAIRVAFGGDIQVGRISPIVDVDGQSAFEAPGAPEVVEVEVLQPDGKRLVAGAVAL